MLLRRCNAATMYGTPHEQDPHPLGQRVRPMADAAARPGAALARASSMLTTSGSGPMTCSTLVQIAGELPFAAADVEGAAASLGNGA
jgi:hypothetical protein